MKTTLGSSRIALVLLVFATPMSANAVLIEGLCDGTAEATVTCDTDTGFEWLDLTETLNLSANQFLADAGGWISDGWSMATGAQVDDLLLNAGFADLTGPLLESQLPAAQLMFDLLGTTFSGSGVVSWGQGWAIQTATDISAPIYGQNADRGVALGSSNSGFTYDHRNDNVGIWANREAVTVPEPNTLALLGLALAGLGVARRKRAWQAKRCPDYGVL